MAYDGSLKFDTKIDTQGFKTGTQTLKSQANGLSSSFSKLGLVVAAAFSVKAIINFGKQAVTLASDLQEVQNVVDTAFGSMSYKMEEFADTAIVMYGLSALSAKKTGSQFMAMAKGMNFANSIASDMAITLTGLSADLASFYNISQDEARTALSSIYTGETETLKRYGILITEVNLQEYARQQGIKKSINAMTQQEKVMLRYNYVMNATKLAQGDFAKTSDSWANQTRILSEKWKEFMSVIGNAIMNVALPCIKALNVAMTWLLETAKNLSSIFGLKPMQTATAGIANDSGVASDNFSDIADSAKSTAKTLKSLAGFDELNTLNSGRVDTGGASVISPIGKIDNGTVDELNKIKDASNAIAESWFFKTNIGKWVTNQWKDVCNYIREQISKVNVSFKSMQPILQHIGETFKEIAPKVWRFVEPILDALWELQKVLGGGQVDVILAFGEAFVYVYDKFLTFYNAFLTFLDKIGVLSMWQTQIVNIVNFIRKVLKSFFDFFINLIENAKLGLGGMLDFLTGVFSGDWELAWSGLGDIVTMWENQFDNIMSFVKNIFADVKDFFGKTCENIGNFFSVLINNIINWFESLPRKIGNFLGQVVGSVLNFGTSLKNWVVNDLPRIINDIINWFKTLPNKIKEVWNTIIDFFNSIPKKMKDFGSNLIKSIWNGIISMGNWFKKKVSDFFGGFADGMLSKFAVGSQISVSPIPRLATGTVVPANYGEFMAVLGDNKKETEVVSPLSTMKQALKEALLENGGSGSNGPTTIVLKVGATDFARVVVDSVNSLTRQTGELAIDLV